MNAKVGSNIIPNRHCPVSSDEEVNDLSSLQQLNDWIPAFAGMTDRVVLAGKYHPNPFEILFDNFVSSVAFIFICANPCPCRFQAGVRHLRIYA